MKIRITSGTSSAAGDAEEFAILVRASQSKLRLFLLRLTNGDEALADDLAQDTFLQAYRNLAQYRGDAAFSTWLHAIGYSRFLMNRRQRRFEALELAEDAGIADVQASSDAKIDLERAMARLSAPERAALTLCYASEFTHEEAAQILGLPLGTVKSHIRRGRERLEKLLKEWR
jgi:RNA polymerase sigma-70 factor (ECF subfamily)